MRPHDHPVADDNQGIVGDIRTFVSDGVSWRAFEFRSPLDPRGRPRLILISGGFSHELDEFPRDWQKAPGEKLTELARSAVPQPIRRAGSAADRAAAPAQLERAIVDVVKKCLSALDAQRDYQKVVRLPPDAVLFEMRDRIRDFAVRARESGARLDHVVAALAGLLHEVRPRWAFDENLRSLAFGWCVDSYVQPRV